MMFPTNNDVFKKKKLLGGWQMEMRAKKHIYVIKLQKILN